MWEKIVSNEYYMSNASFAYWTYWLHLTPPPPNKTTPKDIIKQAVREIIISVYDERPLLLGLRDLVIYSILSYDRSASLK